jgi:hypothetical protein
MQEDSHVYNRILKHRLDVCKLDHWKQKQIYSNKKGGFPNFVIEKCGLH